MKILSADNHQSSKPSTSDVVNIPVCLNKSKTWLKPTDQMDSWLDSQGFYRKHIARDASSLFRCVSEVVFLTQVYHLNVRRHCIQFAIYQSDIFKKLTNIPTKDYIERLSNPREWGTRLDMEVMSLIYGLDFAIYKEVKKPLEKVTNNGFKCSIILSMSYEHHYDSVYPKQHINDAAVCQSILYEILYKQVFKLEEVDYAVNKMLHDKSHSQPDTNMAFFSSGSQMRLEMRDSCRNVKDLLNCGITPFPYKVAKSLDPIIYRNVEYDTWNEQRKGLRHLLNVWNDRELQVGSRCIINFSDKNQLIKRHGYIQQMSHDQGPVIVYIEELAEKLAVPYESLELLPSLVDSESKTENDKDEKSSNKKTENEETIYATDTKKYLAGSVPDLCNVHYVHPTTTVVPSSCYACVSSQSLTSEVINAKPTMACSRSNFMYERSKSNQEVTILDQSASISMQYTIPMYPVASSDLSRPPTVGPTNFSSKNYNSKEYMDNSSSVRILNDRSLDSYYRFGYSPYPYCVVPSNVIYPTLPSDQSVQQNTDSIRTHYSYPLPHIPSEMMYTLPAPTAKTELPPYSTTPLVHPSSSYKGSVAMAACSPAAQIPPTYPGVSSSVYPITYSTYASPPVYYPPYDYYISYPDLQGCENMAPSYSTQPYTHIPIMYSDETYPANSQLYCQPLLPGSLAQ